MSVSEKLDANHKYKRLFEPVFIGELELRNRLVMPAMGTNYGDVQGYVTDKSRAYYAARAKGGVGLVITEDVCVDETGRTAMRQLRIDDDRFVDGLSKLATDVKKHGARFAIQLHHGGRSARKSITTIQPVAPSAIPGIFAGVEKEGDLPHELTIDEIGGIVASFAAAAKRAKLAGADGVEIHSAHYYLIAQFLSLTSNRRQDKYGGTIRNRARLLIEVIKAIRKSVGKKYPVWCRLNGQEFGFADGFTVEEGVTVARLAEDAGVDAVHISAFPISSFRMPPMAEPPGNIVHLAHEVKKVVNIPVFAVGKITPDIGEAVIEAGKADLVAMGKALIADPEIPNKLKLGQTDDIVPCIGCLNCHNSLRGFGTEDGFIRCAVNTMTGREGEYALRPATICKKILVVGGGPAGMEAARVACLRGHKVTIYDKGSKLGGQLLVATQPPYKNGINSMIEYLTRQMTLLDIDIKLNTEVTPEIVKGINLDVIVLATGSNPTMPDIPGIADVKTFRAIDVLSGKSQVGQSVIVIGGELVGCETAEYLLDQGKKVTILRRGNDLAIKMFPVIRGQLLSRLRDKGLTVITGINYENITEQGLIIRDSSGKEQIVKADSVVLASGAESNRQLYQTIGNWVSERYLVGDCVKPGGIFEAIEDGSRVARSI